MSIYPESFQKIIQILKKLPGVGEKSARRMAFSLLKMNEDEVKTLGESIVALKKNVRFCKVCGNITDKEICDICSSSNRDNKKLCVVEEVHNLYSIESTGVYNGKYFVLHGVLSPVKGKGPEELRLDELKKLVEERKVEEVIVATNPTVEGEATALYIKKILSNLPIKVTRISVGLPMGSDIDYSDSFTLSTAFEKRDEI